MNSGIVKIIFKSLDHPKKPIGNKSQIEQKSDCPIQLLNYPPAGQYVYLERIDVLFGFSSFSKEIFAICKNTLHSNLDFFNFQYGGDKLIKTNYNLGLLKIQIMYAVTLTKIRIVKNVSSELFNNFKQETLDLDCTLIFDSTEQILHYEFLGYKDTVLLVGDKNTIALVSFHDDLVTIKDKLELRPVNLINQFSKTYFDYIYNFNDPGTSYLFISLLDKQTGHTELDLFLIEQKNKGEDPSLVIQLKDRDTIILDSCYSANGTSCGVSAMASSHIPGFEYATYLLCVMQNSTYVRGYLIDPNTHKFKFSQEFKSLQNFSLVNQIFVDMVSEDAHNDGEDMINIFDFQDQIKSELKFWIYSNNCTLTKYTLKIDKNLRNQYLEQVRTREKKLCADQMNNAVEVPLIFSNGAIFCETQHVRDRSEVFVQENVQNEQRDIQEIRDAIGDLTEEEIRTQHSILQEAQRQNSNRQRRTNGFFTNFFT